MSEGGAGIFPQAGVSRRQGSLKVVFLSDYFGDDSAATGGAGGAALQSFEALRGLGIDVTLLAGFHAPAAMASDGRCIGLDGYDLREGTKGRLRTAVAAVWNSEARSKLRLHLRDFDPAHTVVVLHQWTRYLSPACLHALSHYPVVAYLHDYFHVCPTGAYFDFRRGRACELKPMGLSCVCTSCDRVGYPHKLLRVARHASKTFAEAAARAPRAFVHVSDVARRIAEPRLPPGRHYTIFNPLGPIPEAPSRADVRFDVGYFGRLEPEKGVRRLTDVLAQKSWTSLFVGAGSLADEIRRLVPGAEVRDWLPHEEALTAMAQCRCVVLPSIWREPWGLVAPEALAMGVPVVISRWAGAAEIVARYGGGEVYEPGEPRALEQALSNLLADEPRLARLSRDAKEVPGRAGLSQEAYARRLAACIGETAGQALDQATSLQIIRSNRTDTPQPRVLS